MNLSDLALLLKFQPESDFKIKRLTADSRKVDKGSVFFLLPRADEKYAQQAHEAGAFVVHSRDIEIDFGIKVTDVASAFSKSLQSFFVDSFEDLKIFGVTGTNGKTTFSYMLKTLLEAYGVPTGIFGTIENSFKDSILDTGLTSPVAEDFYRFNDDNHKKGMKAVVCEVSSHALDQKRLGVDFLSGAAFTSFSQDHLDYHSDMQTYLEAKVKITTEALKGGGFIVGHGSVKEYESFKCSNKKTIGINYSFEVLNEALEGIEIEFSKGNQKLKGLLPLLGSFNAENFALAIAVLCEFFGDAFFPDERIFSSFKQIPGRMEKIDLEGGSLAFIDFSHTPDSLKKSLETLKSYKDNKKLIVVFGCGGDRDKSKRPLMGEIAVSLADEVIVTSDNPRFEDPEEILRDITRNLKEGSFIKIQDRRKAIVRALEASKKEPIILLIAGKGHEPYQEVKGVKNDFLDRSEIYKWLA